jgi:hypothetical protein
MLPKREIGWSPSQFLNAASVGLPRIEHRRKESFSTSGNGRWLFPEALQRSASDLADAEAKAAKLRAELKAVADHLVDEHRSALPNSSRPCSAIRRSR